MKRLERYLKSRAALLTRLSVSWCELATTQNVVDHVAQRCFCIYEYVYTLTSDLLI